MLRSIAPTVATMLFGVGCFSSSPPDSLDIALRGDPPVVLADGDEVPVLFGASGLMMLVLDLRVARGVVPETADFTIEVLVSGQTVAEDYSGARDIVAEGEGFALQWIRVPFSQERCCYECKPAVLRASARDGSGREFAGQVNVTPVYMGSSCPDTTGCCTVEDICPLGIEPTLCE